MPCKGMAYCNRVQRLHFFFLFFLNFFPSIKVDGQPLRVTLATLFHCSQRNQKLTPADAGPKANALQPLLDRYETPLLCWKKLETLPKTNCQTVVASLEKVASFTSKRHFSPHPLRAAENVPL